MNKIKEGMKSVASLLTGIIVAVLALGVDEPWARYLAIGAAVAGAIIVWATPNAETDAQQRVRLAGEEALKVDDGLTYEQAGGQPFDEDPADAASGTPETTQLYQSGEPPAYDVTKRPAPGDVPD